MKNEVVWRSTSDKVISVQHINTKWRNLTNLLSSTLSNRKKNSKSMCSTKTLFCTSHEVIHFREIIYTIPCSLVHLLLSYRCYLFADQFVLHDNLHSIWITFFLSHFSSNVPYISFGSSLKAESRLLSDWNFFEKYYNFVGFVTAKLMTWWLITGDISQYIIISSTVCSISVSILNARMNRPSPGGRKLYMFPYPVSTESLQSALN